VTPAERDEVRRIAAETIDAHTLRHSQTGAALPCACGSCFSARAVLRYVPPGDAPNETMWTIRIVRHQRGAIIEITGDDAVCAPDSARRFAHALHAAVDAAEETTR